jgi:hypothetical protein
MAGIAGCGSRSSGAGLTHISEENRKPGDRDWGPKVRGVRPSQDGLGHIQGYASATSVAAGEQIAFHVSTGKAPAHFTITIHRLGYYAGAGGRLMMTSPRLNGHPQQKPVVNAATGTVRCHWEPSWSLDIPASWTSGLYLASFTSAEGRRASTPFVVRDDKRSSEFLVVLPFTTYQAYNQFPKDGRLGRSLYNGYVPSAHDPAVRALSPDGKAYPVTPVRGHKYCLHYPERARVVSYDRPYAGDGLPQRFQLDQDFISWAEAKGFDLSYASSLDLHEGRVRPKRHQTVVFSGHDEYWSAQMRSAAELSVNGGTNLAFFAANNAYWNVRIDTVADKFPAMTCYKDDPDPVTDRTGPTTRWRDCQPGGVLAEQRLLGTQYTGILKAPVPLVVADSRHWLWAGTHLSDGDRLDGLVVGEADGMMKGTPRANATEHALLSASPFLYKNQWQTQNTSLYRARSGAWVFNAGTFGWLPALGGPPATRDPHIRRATANLFAKLRA